MTNVVPFPTPQRTPTLIDIPRASYTVTIRQRLDGGFDWDVDSGSMVLIPADRLASDLAAIALSLRPPRRSFIERLADLFKGDPE